MTNHFTSLGFNLLSFQGNRLVDCKFLLSCYILCVFDTARLNNIKGGLTCLHFRLGSSGPALEQGYNKLSEKSGSTFEYKHEEVVVRGGRGERRKKRGEIRKKNITEFHSYLPERREVLELITRSKESVPLYHLLFTWRFSPIPATQTTKALAGAEAISVSGKSFMLKLASSHWVRKSELALTLPIGS